MYKPRSLKIDIWWKKLIDDVFDDPAFDIVGQPSGIELVLQGSMLGTVEI